MDNPLTRLLARALRAARDADPRRACTQIAAGRALIGTVGLLAPSALDRFTPEGKVSPTARVGLRMAGARDLALAVGTLLAARRRPESLRGWVEAGVLADTADALIFTLDGAGFTPPARIASAGAAAGAAGVGAVAARRL